MEFHLFLPQLRLSFDRLVASARAAEAAGFRGIAGMDHLVPPGAEAQPMYEAMVVNTWLAAHTERLAVGSLVLCDAFRHPAVLARQAVSLDHATRAAVTETATRRFGAMQPVIGTGPELADHFGRLGDRGVERVYAWFCDFAPPDTLAAFGTEVIGPLAASGPAANREKASR